MTLTEREKEQLKAMIDAGQPLPPRYKAVLFAQPHEAELIWPSKTPEVTNVVLPFQSISMSRAPAPRPARPIYLTSIRAPDVKSVDGRIKRSVVRYRLRDLSEEAARVGTERTSNH